MGDAFFGMLSNTLIDEGDPQGRVPPDMTGSWEAPSPRRGRHAAPGDRGARSRDAWDDLLDWAGQLPIMPRHMYDHELLDAGQEGLLAQKIQEGIAATRAAGEAPLTRTARLAVRDGHRAVDILVRSNLRLVRAMATGTRIGSPLPEEDRIAFGFVGLLRAVETFDPRRGRFSTYATWWIRQSVGRGCDDTERLIRLPVHTAEDLRRAWRARWEMSAALHRAVSVVEVANACEMDVPWLAWLESVSRAPLSLDDCLDRSADGGGTDWVSTILDPDAPDPAEIAEDRIRGRNILAAVDRFEADVALGLLAKSRGKSSWADSIHRDMEMLRLRLGLVDGQEWTLDRIGEQFGVTRERVRQIVKRICEDPDLRQRIAVAAGREDLLPASA